MVQFTKEEGQELIENAIVNAPHCKDWLRESKYNMISLIPNQEQVDVVYCEFLNRLLGHLLIYPIEPKNIREEWVLSRNGKEHSNHRTEKEAEFRLQRAQSQSYEWATTNEGWKIERVKEAAKVRWRDG